jgi:deazaflavin-dependent oxidoreductase (nitroreductase family)
MRALTAVGIHVSLVTDIETTGRKTGLMRQLPVAAAFDDTGAWLISQHGTRSGWGANIAANRTVRLRQDCQPRTATAVMVHDDDVIARALAFSNNPLLGRIIAATFRALQTTPISVRATFTNTEDRLQQTAVAAN